LIAQLSCSHELARATEHVKDTAARLVEWRIDRHLGHRLGVQHRVLREGGCAHEMIDVLTAACDAGLAITTHDTFACEAPDCNAEVTLWMLAELALTCTGKTFDLTICACAVG